MPDIERHIQGNWSSVEEMSGLPMDKASRMERAKYMGFDVDTTYYHGTGADFSEFKNKQERDYGYSGQGYYFTDEPATASFYADTTAKKGGNPNVIPANLKMQNPYIIKEYTDQPRGMQAGQDKGFTEKLKAEGYDGVITKMIDRDSATGEIFDEYIEEVVTFDPKNIRSVNAAFDPSKKDSANLLAGVGAAAVGVSAMSPEQAQAHQQAQKSFINSMLSDNSLESLPSFTTAAAPGIDQQKLPQQFRADVGGFQAPALPRVNQFGQAISGFELPLIGNPVEGVADYLQNFGYDDPATERLKRAAMAGLDVI
jgi:hypothetical protein